MNRPTMLDVTKARTSPRWLDADGYKLPRLYRLIRVQGQGFLKGHAIRNDMIGRKHDHRGPVIAGRHPTSAQRDCRSGISFGRFCNDIFLWERSEQFANCGFLFGVDQNQNAFTRNEAIKPCHGFFEKSFLSDESKQLLRPGVATHWPKPLAATAGENEHVDRIEH